MRTHNNPRVTRLQPSALLSQIVPKLVRAGLVDDAGGRVIEMIGRRNSLSNQEILAIVKRAIKSGAPATQTQVVDAYKSAYGSESAQARMRKTSDARMDDLVKRDWRPMLETELDRLIGQLRGKKQNPLFDRYTVRTTDGSVSKDNILTLSGAERTARTFAGKYPCAGIQIVSQGTGALIKSFAAKTGPGPVKVDRDNTKGYKREEKQREKTAAKFVLYVDGQEFATYDTKKEAEKIGKQEGGRVRVKEVRENPSGIHKFTLAEAQAAFGTSFKAGALGSLVSFGRATLPGARRVAKQHGGLIADVVDSMGKHVAYVVYRPKVANPSGDDAAELFSTFHGADATTETIYQDDIVIPDAYAELGDMIELWVIPMHAKNGKAVKVTAPDPDRAKPIDVVKLASSPDGKQLHFIGGDQALDIKALGFSDSEERHNMLIGVLAELTYRTAKKFHKFRPTDYFHKLGEEDGNEPVLMYDPYSEKMSVAGGNYRVKDVGIVN